MKQICSLILLIIAFDLAAQEPELFESLQYEIALQKETRSRDGMPGPAYWQNHADYKLEVTLDTLNKRISGKSQITYHNESPDSLSVLWFRIYPDSYMKGGMRNYPIDPEEVHEGATIGTIVINDIAYITDGDKVSRIGTNMSVTLDKKVASGKQVHINCEWIYPLQDPGRRSGYYGNDSYFIAYFYPQIAVYDDINGWDFQLSHLGIQEFYNDVNNYRVTIHVPQNFRVWAAGKLENTEAVYPEFIAERISRAAKSDEVVHIITKEDLEKDISRDSTWIFSAEGIRDFAFGTSPAHIWDGASIVSGDRRIAVHAAYPPTSKFNMHAVDIARKTIDFTTRDFPGVPFPYDQSTTYVKAPGRGGMEFPMIANNGDYDDYNDFIIVTFHEIFHNYTPFMLGTNEKRYTWMDEGWAKYTTDRFYEYFRSSDEFPDSVAGEELQEELIRSYSNQVMWVEDRPLYDAFLDANIFNWRLLGYNKPAIAYGLFIDMVGKEAFKAALSDFISNWAGKHPVPHDFFYSLNESLGENYNWFWKAWFFDRGWADLALEYKEQRLIIKRTGALPVPVKLVINHKDGSSETIEKSMDVWKDGKQELSIPLDNPEELASAFLDVQYIPDLWDNNNLVEINP